MSPRADRGDPAADLDQSDAGQHARGRVEGVRLPAGLEEIQVVGEPASEVAEGEARRREPPKGRRRDAVSPRERRQADQAQAEREDLRAVSPARRSSPAATRRGRSGSEWTRNAVRRSPRVAEPGGGQDPECIQDDAGQGQEPEDGETAAMPRFVDPLRHGQAGGQRRRREEENARDVDQQADRREHGRRDPSQATAALRGNARSRPSPSGRAARRASRPSSPARRIPGGSGPRRRRSRGRGGTSPRRQRRDPAQPEDEAGHRHQRTAGPAIARKTTTL